MLREGKGNIPPKPVEVPIYDNELAKLSTEAERRAKARGYAQRSDVWGNGLIRNPILVGLVGELAVTKYLASKLAIKLSVDMEDKPSGDGGNDVLVYGVSIQVKTRRQRGTVWIRRRSESGRIQVLKWILCVAATWNPDDPAAVNIATLDGWKMRKDLPSQSSYTDARVGFHMNLELDDSLLEPMDSLVEYLRAVDEYRRLA